MHGVGHVAPAMRKAHLKTARTDSRDVSKMVFWEERALAATVPRSPSLSYSSFTFFSDLPVAWPSACRHKRN